MASELPIQNDKPAAETLSREQADALIASGGDLPMDALKTVLREMSSVPASPELQALYLKRALDNALDTRDPEIALLIARIMDANEVVDGQVWAWLSDEMGKQPDAVYAFVRARLAAEPGERWLPRLQHAANTSLQVAIADGDWITIHNWLKLIAREPAAYDLADSFARGIRLAQPRAHDEPQLATALIVLAAKRNQASLDALLADGAILDALTDENLRAVLTDQEGDAAAILNVYGADVFLAAVARATQAQHPALILPAVVEQVWGLLTAPAGTIHVTGDYTPDAILESWIEAGADWLHTDAITALLRIALADRRDDIFHRVISRISERTDLIALVSDALYRSGRGVNEVLALISQMVANRNISAQGAVDLFARLLRIWEWNKTTLLMMAQLARAIQYHPELTLEPDVLWHMLDIAAEAKEDLITRVAARRIASMLETVEDDAALAEALTRLVTRASWNNGARSQLMHWWRGFARSQNAARLARLEKAFDKAKGLDELRSILRTLIAFRRWVGKRTLGEFADAISAAYEILDTLATAFDSDARDDFRFDPATVRAEFDARSEELNPHTRKILANDLKEIATLIADMGDHRSKPGFARRGEDVDRALMTGGQEPESAVDTLKWLSGYLSGAQEESDGEETKAN